MQAHAGVKSGEVDMGLEYEAALEVKTGLYSIELMLGRICESQYMNAPTRRERIAIAALQGILADPNSSGSYAEIANKSVEWADALIAELDKTESSQ